MVLVNSNPATIMTDPELADRTYVEPLTVEVLEAIIERERVEAIILAGTELSLIFNEANMDFPHIDGSRLHLDSIMRQLTTPDRGQ